MKKRILAVLTFSILILTSCNTKPDVTSTLVENSTTTSVVVDEGGDEAFNNDSSDDSSDNKTTESTDSNISNDGNVAPDDGVDWSKPELF